MKCVLVYLLKFSVCHERRTTISFIDLMVVTKNQLDSKHNKLYSEITIVQKGRGSLLYSCPQQTIPHLDISVSFFIHGNSGPAFLRSSSIIIMIRSLPITLLPKTMNIVNISSHSKSSRPLQAIKYCQTRLLLFSLWLSIYPMGLMWRIQGAQKTLFYYHVVCSILARRQYQQPLV